MNVIVAASYEEMSRVAADLLAQCVREKPGCVLGLATGTTPIGLYAELVKDHQAGKLSFADVTTFNLDEYCGLSPEHDQSCADEQEASDAYESAIEEAGGIDIQLLGIGHNGHIGFNEPGEEFSKHTHTVHLTEMTREANSRLFDSIDEVPTSARTMGIGTIMRARKLLLVANGAGKARIVKQALEGPVTPQVPASILQFHPDVTVVLDPEAGALLGR